MDKHEEANDQEARIRKMRAEIERLGGIYVSNPETPPDVEEKFLEEILNCECCKGPKS